MHALPAARILLSRTPSLAYRIEINPPACS